MFLDNIKILGKVYYGYQKNFNGLVTPRFFSDEINVTRKSLNENQLRYTYQKHFISDLDSKHKKWSNLLTANFKSFR